MPSVHSFIGKNRSFFRLAQASCISFSVMAAAWAPSARAYEYVSPQAYKPVNRLRFNTIITFNNNPVGTVFTDQAKSLGIIFGGDTPFITTDGANPTSPVLSGTPKFFGAIEGYFVDPSTGAVRTVDGFSLDAGYFDEAGTTRLTWYDKNGKIISSATNNKTGIQTFIVNYLSRDDSVNPPKLKSQSIIAKWRIESISADPAGFAVDNVSFNGPTKKCSDPKLNDLIKEYSKYVISLSPRCENFTKTARSVSYSFSELNSGKYAWALIRTPLVIGASANFGLEAFAAQVRIKFLEAVDRPINSGYRNPAHNIKFGAADSRHVYGDAVDFPNITRTRDEYDKYLAAYTLTGGDFTEPPTQWCKLSCFHVDWRYHGGSYVAK